MGASLNYTGGSHQRGGYNRSLVCSNSQFKNVTKWHLRPMEKSPLSCCFSIIREPQDVRSDTEVGKEWLFHGYS